ncbi:MAG: ABC transporter permease subunit [Candidatus Methanomethylophilaceae archaeon]|nr:ABC transporter permease subunit [Candidatus Methanomethylophilaceae archaeon]
MSKREAKAQRKMAKKYSTSTTDSYDESSRTITDEEAHRNVSYELPSKLRQIKECFMIQMKRYTRQKIMWFAAVLLILIPVIFFTFENVPVLKTMLPSTEVTNIYIVSLLMFMPLIVPLLCAIACGSMLSQEFNERTVYLSLPLPMSRSAFFIGKFLAALALIEGVVFAAYGICMILAMSVTTRTYTLEIVGSLVIMVAYVFFCCAVTYAMSTKLRRGSTMFPFIFLFALLPLVGVVVAFIEKTGTIVDIMSYLPCFAPDAAMLSLGNNAPISVMGVSKVMFAGLTFSPGSSTVLMTLIPIAIGVVMLILGKRAVKRRDM